MHHLIETWFHWVQTGGYAAVFWLMALESTVVPIPSEVVVPPAAIVAATQQDSGMTLVGVVIAGTLGSWFGSAIMYWLAFWLGRTAMLRWGKYFLVPPPKFYRAEAFMHKYEAGGIFFARLLPVIRHLISIPAGIIRMGFLKFSILTTIGAAIWCAVLAWLGGKVGDHLRASGLDPLQHPAELVKATKHESLWIIGAVLLVCVLYFAAMRLTARQPEDAGA